MSKIVDLTGLSRFWSNVDKKKASIDGTYPLLVSGDLAGRGESVPASFGFRASGGKSIKDGRAYIKRIKGNSVVWNQKYDTIITGSTNVNFCELPSEISNGHVVYLEATCIEKGGTIYVSLNESTSDFEAHGGITITASEKIQSRLFRIQKNVKFIYVYNPAEESYTISSIRLHDLTQMFGAGNEPTTIEEYEARKPIVADEYAYNEGEVIHCNTESIKSVGDNAFDNSRNSFKEYNLTTDGDFSLMNTQDLYVGVTKNGYSDKYAITQYAKTDNGYSFVNSRGGYGLGAMVKALPNEEYHLERTSEKGGIGIGFYDSDKHIISFIYNLDSPTFTTPNNCAYILLILTAQDAYIGQEITISNIMLSLVHSGWKAEKDDQYQPYWQDTLPLPIIRKYFPDGMKKAGSAHDEIRYNKASGKWEAVQRIGSVDMGTLNWTLEAFGFGIPSDQVRAINMAFGDAMKPSNCLCYKYYPAPTYDLANLDKVMRMPIKDAYYEVFTIKDTSYTDVESFKADMAGVMLYYELAGPIVTEITEDFRDYYNVADFGTEMSQSNNVPSAPFSADIIYQFNAVDMIREHETEINELQDAIKAMQAQLTSLINK